MQYDKASEFITGKLKTGLPAYLTYHDSAHTERVLAAVVRLGSAENINAYEMQLLKTAALFHDSGFLQDHNEHEELSCKLAMKYLPEFEYTADDIEQVCYMIRATKLPQSPGDNKLSHILCDADLYYLGTDDYMAISEKLYKEFKRNGIVKTQTEWLLKQSEFLKNHHYFTATANEELSEGKKRNLELIQKQIDSSLINHHKRPGVLPLDVLQMIGGVLIAGIALKGFLVPNRFFDGGVTGISLLVHEIYHFNLAVVITLFNLPLIVVSYFTVNRRFTMRMLAGVLMLGLTLQFLPEYALTGDKLLIAIFGGVFLGIGVGLVMRAGAALDGIEVLALYTLKRTSFTITEIILGINIIIFSIAAFKFNIETALYSILTYFCVTRTIDYVVEGIQAYTGVTIISGKSELIKYQLVNELGRGITVYKGERGFLPGKFEISSDCDIIFTVITRLELRRLKNLVYEADPKAFVFASTIKEASGGVLSRRHAH